MRKGMKSRSLSLFLAVSIILAQLFTVPVTAEDTQEPINLVANPGFEDAVSVVWAPYGGKIVNDQANAYAGNYCAVVETVGSAVPQIIPASALKPNTTYVLKAMAKATNGGIAVIGVEKYGGTNVYAPNITSETYKEYTVEFTTGATLTNETTVTLTQWAFGVTDRKSVV